MARRIRLFFGLTGVMAVLAGFALPSDAGLLGTGSASYCDPDSAQTFRPWSDSSYYMLTPGGSFESGSPSWDLNGGAKVVSGNESYYLHSKSDGRSLYMPSGSSATSPTMCFAAGDWHLRFVGKGSGKVRVTLFGSGGRYRIETLNSGDRKSTRLNSSHCLVSRMPSSA